MTDKRLRDSSDLADVLAFKADKSALGSGSGYDAVSKVVPGKLPVFYNIGGTGIPALDITGNGILFQAVDVGSSDVHTFRIDRTANYTGGQFGFINSALQVNSRVMQNANTFEASAIFIQHNYANRGEGGISGTPQNFNVAFKTYRHGTAPIWGFVAETYDDSGVADPTTGHLGGEVDITANGTDANRNRVGIGIIVGRPGDALGNHTGPTCVAGHGVLLVRQVTDTAPNRYRSGFACGAPYAPTEFEVGFDTRWATFNLGGVAINLAEGQKIAFDAAQARNLYSFGGFLSYQVGGNDVFRISDLGNALLKGSSIQLQTSKTPTGTNDPSGNLRDLCGDDNYLYYKSSTGWGRLGPFVKWNN